MHSPSTSLITIKTLQHLRTKRPSITTTYKPKEILLICRTGVYEEEGTGNNLCPLRNHHPTDVLW